MTSVFRLISLMFLRTVQWSYPHLEERSKQRSEF